MTDTVVDLSSRDGSEEVIKISPPVPFSQLFRYADPWDKALMVIGTTAAILLGASFPGFSQLFGNLINDLASGEKAVSRISLEMTIVGGFAWVMGWIAMTSFSYAGNRQMRVLRQTFFSSILRQEVAMFDLTKAGELANRMSSDVHLVSQAIGPKFANLAQSLSTFAFSYAFAFYRSWRLTLVMLAVLPVLVACGAILGIILTSATARAQEAYAQAGGIAQEVLSSIRTVHAFGMHERECQRYTAKIKLTEKQGIRKGTFTGLSVGATLCILFSSYALAFYYGSYLIHHGIGDGGVVVAVFFSILIGGFQLGVATPIFTTINVAKGAAGKIYEIIDRIPAMNVSADDVGMRLPNLKGTIEFRNVAFRYPSRPDVPIFNDFSLTIRPGQKVALVGPSGSGKSSVVALIERFYDVDAGEILIDDVPLKDLNLHFWRDQVGIVTQEPTLFSATVMENIIWANPNATRDDVIQACKDAFIHDVIEQLPSGYDTYVGEGGSQLSGGQKQRVAIARAIIKNPKILLLDEATSALDRNSETIVQEALNNVMRGRTVLTIAHRLVTIQDADCIYFIQPRDAQAKEGSLDYYSRVLESGTHEELMKLNGEYAQLVQTQHRASEVEPPASPLDADDEELVYDEVRNMGSINAGNESMARARGKSTLSVRSETAKRPRQSSGAVWRTAKLNASEWPWLLFGALGAAAAGSSYPIYSVLFSKVVTVFYRPDIEHIIWKWCLLFLSLGILNFFAHVVKVYCLNLAGEKLTSRLRILLFRALVRQDIAFFDTPGNESGALCARLAADTTKIQNVWAGALGTNIQAGVCLFGGLALAFWTSWKLALVTCSAVPPLVIAVMFSNRFMYQQDTEGNSSGNSGGQIAAESISGCRTVFAFNLQAVQMRRYEEHLNQTGKNVLLTALGFGLSFGFSQFVIYAAFALSYWYGGVLVRAGEIGLLEVLRCSLGVLMGAMGVGEVFAIAGDQSEGHKAAEHVYELLDRVPAIDGTTDEGPVMGSTTGGSVFNDVTFHYPTRRDVRILNHLKLNIKAGQQVALLGATGCGKSTIISLLMRFYDPVKGELKVEGQVSSRYYDPPVDGIPMESVALSNLNLRNWRQHCGIVSQEPILFDDTVAANIRYGKPDATDEEVYEAAKMAQVHDFIMSLPQGYETNVGAKGSQLSGGQKQRVAIARCIIRKPTLLLLDEATSALDNVSEKEVQAALDEIVMSGKMTVVVVAHRLSTIKNCQLIIVMSEGKIVEQGSHEQLYALGGDYRRRYDQYYGITGNATP